MVLQRSKTPFCLLVGIQCLKLLVLFLKMSKLLQFKNWRKHFQTKIVQLNLCFAIRHCYIHIYEKKIGSGDHRKLTSMDVRNCLLSITKNVADNEIRTDYPSLCSLGWGAWVFDTSRVAFQFLDSGEIKCWNSLLQKVLRTLSRYWSPIQSKFGQQSLGEEGSIPWTKQEHNCIFFFFVIYIASNANCKNLPLAC